MWTNTLRTDSLSPSCDCIRVGFFGLLLLMFTACAVSSEQRSGEDQQDYRYILSQQAGPVVDLISVDHSVWKDTGDWKVVGDVFLKSSDPKLLGTRPGSGILVNGADGHAGDLYTRKEFGDVRLHAEFMMAEGSNSGIYFMSQYEVQIRDSWGEEDLDVHDAGAIYERWDPSRESPGYEGQPPAVNASKPPGTWQTYDIIFRAPRFNENNEKIENARFNIVIYNGRQVHQEVEVTGPTRGGTPDEERRTGPLRIQGDHGPVAFRNLWIRELDDSH